MLFTASLVAVASLLALRGGREGLFESLFAIAMVGVALGLLFKMGSAG
jgi:hypothetical protein